MVTPETCRLKRVCHEYITEVSRGSVSIDVNYGSGKRFWSLLWKVVTDAAGDDPACIFACELLAIGCRVRRVWRTVGIAFKGDGGHGDGRKLSELLFEFVILRFAFRQSNSPAIVVNHDGDMIRIVEGRCGAIECRIVKVPFGRSDLPNELRKIAAVFVVAEHAALRGEIELVPPL